MKAMLTLSDVPETSKAAKVRRGEEIQDVISCIDHMEAGETSSV